MDTDKAKTLFDSNLHGIRHESPETYREIIDLTGYLPKDAGVKQRLWHIIHGPEVPLCSCCNVAEVKWKQPYQKYAEICRPCVSRSPKLKEKRKQTSLKHYGTEHPRQNKKEKERITRTWNNKNNNEIREITEKRKHTNLEKYGVSNPQQNKDIREKTKQTIIGKYRGVLRKDAIEEKNKKYKLDEYGAEYSSIYFQLIKNSIMVDGMISHGYRKPYNLKIKFPDLYAEIITSTGFLPENAGLGERIYCIRNNITSRIACSECGEEVNFKNGRYFEYCSLKCSNNSQKVKNRKEKSNSDRFGVKHPTQLEIIRQKQRDSFKERYGVEYPFQNEEIRKKMKNKVLEKYGVENASQAEVIKEKIRKTNLEKYGSKSYAQKDIPKDSLKKLENGKWMRQQHIELEKPLVLIAEQLDVSDVTVKNYLHSHNIETRKFYSSIGEKEILSFLSELIPNATIMANTRSIIPPLEVDIYIPEYSIAIEYCGLYWHSETVGKNRNYHKNKLDLCNRKNIRLITIFEDEWIYKQSIVKNTIKNILNLNDSKSIYARNTQIIELSSKEKKEFLNNFHIQGNGRGSINYGLLFNGEIIACASFMKIKEIFILDRYATSFHITGGFSKLLKHFQKNNIYKKIITFADLRWSEGDLYEKCGFTHDKTLPPDYYYIEHGHRVHKANYRHKNLSKKLKHYDPSLSEKENCEKNGIQRIWNCGLKKYIINQ
jgi:hypothetical protein